MTYAELGIILGLLGLGWLWLDGIEARESGIRAVRTACEAEGLQLLAETIAIAQMRPRRDESGRLCWHRVYQFEYTDTGDNRRPGCVQLLGRRVMLVHLGLRAVT